MEKRDKKILEYVQAYVPDYEDLAILVTMAKGPDRSMAEFARKCKVKGPSTFSRIVNQLIDKPLSDELLMAIAENAANPQEVTLDMLMSANGKILKSLMNGGTPANDDRKLFKTQTEKIKVIRDILTDHYLDIGYPVTIHPDLKLSDEYPSSRYGLNLPSDFALEVKGLGPKLWNFAVDFTDLSAVPYKSSRYDITSLMTETMNRYSSLFLRDAWEPESLKGFKNTIIFTEEKAYAMFRVLLKDVKTNTPISAMYVNSDVKKIDLEYILEHKNR